MMWCDDEYEAQMKIGLKSHDAFSDIFYSLVSNALIFV